MKEKHKEYFNWIRDNRNNIIKLTNSRKEYYRRKLAITENEAFTIEKKEEDEAYINAFKKSW